jgi:peptide/nickel transport system substrate-binding protein
MYDIEDGSRMDLGQAQTTRRDLLAQAALGVIVLGGVAGCGGGSSSASGSSSPAGTPKPGGTLSYGLSLASSTETLDPNKALTYPDVVKATNTFDTLTEFGPSDNVELRLAESFEPSPTGDKYVVKLRKNVLWHDGTPLTADDVIYTIRRVLDPATGSGARGALLAIDGKGLRKLDPLTVEIPLHAPNVFLPGAFAQFTMQIVKNGATKFNHPIGTGPFKFVSWVPQRQSQYIANKDYWKDGQPYLDGFRTVSITDPTARLGALTSGQVLAIDSVPPTQTTRLKGNSAFHVIVHNSNQTIPLTMACDIAPFSDVRVRQAVRLIADRPQLLSSSFVGFGQISNDLYGQGQPLYDRAIPQRHQDIEKARSLLKQSGHSGLTVTLTTSPVVPGMVESATAFAAEAQQAGVTVKLDQVPAADYFGTNYLKYAFGQSAWNDESLPLFFAQALGAQAPYNETHWNDSAWNAKFAQAQRETNAQTQAEIMGELQQTLWDEGGYVQWADPQWVDATSATVHGISQARWCPLGGFDFRGVWIQ